MEGSLVLPLCAGECGESLQRMSDERPVSVVQCELQPAKESRIGLLEPAFFKVNVTERYLGAGNMDDGGTGRRAVRFEHRDGSGGKRARKLVATFAESKQAAILVPESLERRVEKLMCFRPASLEISPSVCIRYPNIVHIGDFNERLRRSISVADRSLRGEQLLIRFQRERMLSMVKGQAGKEWEQSASNRWTANHRGESQDLQEPFVTFGDVAARKPDLEQQTGLPAGALNVRRLYPPTQGGPLIVMLAFQLVELFRGWKFHAVWIQPLRIQ